MIETNQILSKLEKVRPSGKGKWLACCPAHPDKSPSLAIKETDDGKILMHCFSGCHVSDVLAAVGLELSDLMPDDPTYKKGSKPPAFNKYELFDRLVFETTILSLAVRQLLNGKTLDAKDQDRVVLAESTINDIARECRR